MGWLITIFQAPAFFFGTFSNHRTIKSKLNFDRSEGEVHWRFFWGKKKEKIHRIARVQAEEPSIFAYLQLGVSKNRGKTPKMDGENNGKPLFFNGWFGGGKHPTIFGNKPTKALEKMWADCGGRSTESTSLSFLEKFGWRFWNGDFLGHEKRPISKWPKRWGQIKLKQRFYNSTYRSFCFRILWLVFGPTL